MLEVHIGCLVPELDTAVGKGLLPSVVGIVVLMLAVGIVALMSVVGTEALMSVVLYNGSDTVEWR